MNATATTPQSSRPTAAERFEEIAPVFSAGRGAGPSVFVLVGPFLLLVLLLVPPFAFLVVILAAVALPFVAAALVVAVVASPYLMFRAVHRRLAERHTSTQRSAPIAARVAHTRRPTQQPGLSS
jgi:membrane protein implicated in regulation of membrane protease activity